MKPHLTTLPFIIRFLLVLACATLAANLRAADDPAPAFPTNTVATGSVTNAMAETAAAPSITPDTNAPAPAISSSGTNTMTLTSGTPGTNAPQEELPSSADPDSIRLNFRGVPLEMVLNYLSEAAGFIIVLETQPRGRVDAWSNKPLTREETVTLLNTVLARNGLAAIRKGRTLTIVNRDEAKLKSIPVRLGSDPESIPDTDEMVTQIIPVRYVDATQLIKDIQPLLSVQTPMTANESGNSIVITDTQANIRRVAEVIKAIDMGAEDVTEVRVFRLENADPSEMSDLLSTLFPDETRTGGGQSGQGGFRSFFRGMVGGPPGMGGQGGSGSQNQRIRKRARVLAVPDARTGSVVVTAAKDLMEQVAQVVNVLDADAAKRQSVRVFQLENADPQEAAEVLQDIFQKNTTTQNRNNRNQNSVLQNRSDQQQQFNQSSSGFSGNRSNTRRNTSSR